MPSRPPTFFYAAAISGLLCLFAATQALAASKIRLAIQKTGTVAWDIDVIRHNGLDRKNDVELEVVELASTEGGKIAVRSGAADLMVSDWLWVSRERALGAPMQFVPYSAAVGALVVPDTSPIRTLGDLKGRKLSIAGGSLDKSWLLVQAAAKREGVDLRRDAHLAYGAPPLLFEKLLQGEHDASLTYWNFAARLETKGYRRLLSVEDAAKAMGASGGVSMLGYVFDEQWAAKNADGLSRFLKAAGEAKTILAGSDSEWDRIRPLTQASDDAAFAAYRARYREGIPTRSTTEEETDARRLYKVLAELGGAELVGPASELDPGTYYKPAPGL